MADVKFFKPVGALPALLQPDAFYIVRTGQGFDLYLTDHTGTVGHTLNGLSTADVAGLMAEIVDARGGRASLGRRLDTLSNFASPNAGPFIPGRWYDQSFHAANSGNYGIAQNRTEVSPFYASQSFAIDRIGVNVTTAAPAGGLGRLLIYGSDPVTGMPDGLEFESPDIDFSLTTGLVGYTFPTPFVFERNRTYWIGIRVGAVTGMIVRAVTTSSTMNFGLLNETASAYCTMLRKTGIWAAGTPSPWVPEAADYVNGTPASIRMRAVAMPNYSPAYWSNGGQPADWTYNGAAVDWIIGA